MVTYGHLQMADAPIGVIPPPAAPTAAPVEKFQAIREAKAAKLAQVKTGLTKLSSEQAAEPVAEKTAPQAEADKVAPTSEEKPVEAKPEEPKPDAKVEAKPDEEADPKTAKALAQIDKQAKKFREEQAAAKKSFEAEMAQARADFARERAEFKAVVESHDQLKQMAKRDPIGLLRQLGIENEDEWETVGRGAFPFTKAGKADPRAAEIAARSQKEVTRDTQIDELRKMVTDLTDQIKTRDQQAEMRSFVETWQADAVKAIPTDKPTLAARLLAKSPAKVKQKLLEIGAELERNNDNETPTHDEVIAEFERRERLELEERGVDVDALLKPAAPAKPSPKSPLDIEAPKGTRPINGTPSRAEKLAALEVAIKRRDAEQQ